jgi:hypothetical protein
MNIGLDEILLVFLLICFVRPDYVKNKAMFVLAVLAVTLMFFGRLFLIFSGDNWAQMINKITTWVGTTSLVPLLYLACFPGAGLADMTKPQMPTMPGAAPSTPAAPPPAAPPPAPPAPPTPPAA